MTRILIFLMFLAWLPIGTASAAPERPKSEEEIPPGALYRYQTQEGQVVVTSTLPREAIATGYEILDRHGRTIRKVEPAPTQEDLERLEARRQEKLQRERQREEDKRLRRLYAGPEDAIRARDRQLEALRLNIEYTRNSIGQVEEKLSEEISVAADYERKGQAVPESVRGAIERYQRQLRELNQEIEQYEADMEEVRAEFKPIIERLRVLAGKNDNTDTGAEATATESPGPEDQPGQ